MDNTDDDDMQNALKKDNVVKIVRPQTSAEQEAKATQQLAETLEEISVGFRKDMLALIQAYQDCRKEKTCLSIRLMFLEAKLKALKKHMRQMYSLYRQAQMDFVAVKRESKRRNKNLESQ